MFNLRPLAWPMAAMLLSMLPGLAHASEFDGAQLSVLWGVPFAGIFFRLP